ncbi:hypothetical protein MTO96_042819 [Rhipicephalus appendiculatus]
MREQKEVGCHILLNRSTSSRDSNSKVVSVNLLISVIKDSSTKSTRIEASIQSKDAKPKLKPRPMFNLTVIFADEQCLVLEDAPGVLSNYCYMWSTGGNKREPSSYCRYIYLTKCKATFIETYDSKTCNDDNRINRGRL